MVILLLNQYFCRIYTCSATNKNYSRPATTSRKCKILYSTIVPHLSIEQLQCFLQAVAANVTTGQCKSCAPQAASWPRAAHLTRYLEHVLRKWPLHGDNLLYILFFILKGITNRKTRSSRVLMPTRRVPLQGLVVLAGQLCAPSGPICPCVSGCALHSVQEGRWLGRTPAGVLTE